MSDSMSQRQQVAQNLAETCIFGGLNDSYGVSIDRATDKKGKPHWSVLFCKARILDGIIRVYSPGFIMISWQTAIRDLPSKGMRVFKAEHEAKEFLVNSFIR